MPALLPERAYRVPCTLIMIRQPSLARPVGDLEASDDPPSAVMNAPQSLNRRIVEDTYEDFEQRRNGLLLALTEARLKVSGFRSS